MSLFNKIKEKLSGGGQNQIQNTRKTESIFPSKSQKHELINFSQAYRIGIIAQFTNIDDEKKIGDYKKELERNGYECEVLLYIGEMENMPASYLPSFSYKNLNKEGKPADLRTDRFIIKRFDLLFLFYSHRCMPLHYIAANSAARCRVSMYNDEMKNYADLFIPLSNDEEGLDNYIKKINSTLVLQPYVRKEI